MLSWRLGFVGVVCVLGVAGCRADCERAEATTPGDERGAPPRGEREGDAAERNMFVEHGQFSLMVLPDGRVAIEDVAITSPIATFLEPGDVVTHVDGRRVASAAELEIYLDQVRPGDVVWFSLLRQGRRQDIVTQLVPAPARAEAAPSPAPAAPAQPPAAATPPQSAQQPPVVVVVPQGGGAPGGGGELEAFGEQPPAYSAPGLPQTPGATFAPGPATQMEAYPQLPGISQSPWFQVPLGFGLFNLPGQAGPGGATQAAPRPGAAGTPSQPGSMVPPPNATPRTVPGGPVLPPAGAVAPQTGGPGPATGSPAPATPRGGGTMRPGGAPAKGVPPPR
jgi:hypothetical protein